MAAMGLASSATSVLAQPRTAARLVGETAARARRRRRIVAPLNYGTNTNGLVNSQGKMLMDEGIMFGDVGRAKIEGIANIVLPDLGLAKGATGSSAAASFALTSDKVSQRPVTSLDVRVATAGGPRNGVAARVMSESRRLVA